MPKHFSNEERASIEKKILSAARESFLYYGINKTNIADITKAAGIAKGTFYLFFKSKGDIFMKLISDDWTAIHEELDAGYMGKKGDISTPISDYIAENRKALLGHPLFSMIYNREAIALISDHTVTEALMDFKQKSDSQLVEIIKSWFEANDIKSDISPEVISGMIRSTSYLNYHKDEIGEEIFDEVISDLIKGIILLLSVW